MSARTVRGASRPKPKRMVAVILGVMSDTHGNSPLMHRVADYMVQQLGVQIVFHLGDDYTDAEELMLAGHDVRRVPGLWCYEYQDSRIPKRILEEMGGITVAAVHAEKDLRFSERAAGVILVGHTHEPRIMKLGLSLYVNPGHLKSPVNRGNPATFALVEISEDTISAALYGWEGIEREWVTIPREQLA